MTVLCQEKDGQWLVQVKQLVIFYGSQTGTAKVSGKFRKLVYSSQIRILFYAVSILCLVDLVQCIAAKNFCHQ